MTQSCDSILKRILVGSIVVHDGILVATNESMKKKTQNVRVNPKQETASSKDNVNVGSVAAACVLLNVCLHRSSSNKFWRVSGLSDATAITLEENMSGNVCLIQTN
jgi:hypothetical protein